MLLWLCHRLAAAALIRPLAWEQTYAGDSTLKKKKKKKGNVFFFPRDTKLIHVMTLKWFLSGNFNG